MKTQDEIKEIKTKLQYGFLNLWAEKHNCQGTGIFATGVGKTRIGVVAACEFIRRSNYTERSLILTPTETLRDNEWPNEIKKWGYEDCLPFVTIECIQTAYKWRNKFFNTVVADEVHKMLSNLYSKVFVFNKFERRLGLSATIDSKTERDKLVKFKIPIIYEYDFNQAAKDGILPPYEAYNLGVELNNEERELYEEYTDNIKKLSLELSLHYPTLSAFQTADLLLKGKLNVKHKSLAFSFYKYASLRKQIVSSAASKFEALLDLSEFFPQPIIIFGEYTDFCNAATQALGDQAVAYHSNISKKEKNLALEQFRKGEKRILVSAKALNAGVNIPSVEVGIAAAGTSKNLDDTQRRGRILRPAEGKKAYYINLYCLDTVEKDWASKRRAGKPIKWIKSIDEIS
jgi:superfamily II DNA or RNA helicase